MIATLNSRDYDQSTFLCKLNDGVDSTRQRQNKQLSPSAHFHLLFDLHNVTGKDQHVLTLHSNYNCHTPQA